MRSAASASIVKGYDAALDEARKRSEFKGVEQAVEGIYREALARAPWPRAGALHRLRRATADEGKIRALIAGGALVERA